MDLNKLQTISLDHQKLEEIDITKLYSRIKQIFAEIIKNTLATEDK